MVYTHPLTVILIFLHVIYNQRPESSPTRAIGKKHQMNDVPDPPTTADVDVVCKQVIWSYWYSYTERYLKILCMHMRTVHAIIIMMTMFVASSKIRP